MTAFHLSIVAGSIGADELVSNPQFTGSGFKAGLEVALAMGKAAYKLKAVIGLDTLNSNAFEGKIRNDIA